MRKKKIRGHRSIWKEIENWRLDNLDFNLTDYLQNDSDKYYAKIRVNPWNGFSLTSSEIPQPKGKTKQKILEGLLDIYEDWKGKLDKLGKPYYLKVWLFEPHFSQSQVVVAIGDSLDFYETTFFKPGETRKLDLDNYGQLKSRLENFTWDHRLDEDHYDNTEVGDPGNYISRQDYEDTLKVFERLLKKPHRTNKFKEPIGEATESYSFKLGDIWLGEKK